VSFSGYSLTTERHLVVTFHTYFNSHRLINTQITNMNSFTAVSNVEMSLQVLSLNSLLPQKFLKDIRISIRVSPYLSQITNYHHWVLADSSET
jgi:hypothetical protein